MSAVWSGRVLRVRLVDDPQVDADLADADLIGAIDGNQLLIDGDRLPLQLEGRHNARNLLLAVAVADQLGVSRKALPGMQVMVPGGRNRRMRSVPSFWKPRGLAQRGCCGKSLPGSTPEAEAVKVRKTVSQLTQAVRFRYVALY